MNKESAKRTSEKILTIAPRINETIRELMMTGPSGRQFNEYRKLAGEVFGLLYGEFLHPIFREYPELEPKAWSTVSSPEEPIDRAVAEKISEVMRQVSDFLATLPAEDRAQFEGAVNDLSSGIAAVISFIERSNPNVVTNRPT